MGLVHRQFAGDDLPEWFEAIEVYYHPVSTDLSSLLKHFWEAFPSGGDLLFYQEAHQEPIFRKAWAEFRSSLPRWAVSQPLELRLCNWFEPAEPEKQKLALRGIPALEKCCAGLDLSKSHLATKINSIAAGYGSDQQVVLLAARYGLDDGLTLALRTILYFARLV